MALPDEIAADVAELETEIPASLSWNGTEYPCLNGTTSRRKDLGSGGYGLDADLILFLRAAHFESVAARPQLKQLLTFESRSYRIEEIRVPAGSPFLRLICVEANRSLVG